MTILSLLGCYTKSLIDVRTVIRCRSLHTPHSPKIGNKCLVDFAGRKKFCVPCRSGTTRIFRVTIRGGQYVWPPRVTLSSSFSIIKRHNSTLRNSRDRKKVATPLSSVDHHTESNESSRRQGCELERQYSSPGTWPRSKLQVSDKCIVVSII